MKLTIIKRAGLALSAIIGALSLAIIPASALDAAKTSDKTGASAGDQAKLKVVITRGNSEITRRLKSLNELSGKISSEAKLSANDQASLSAEVSSEISNLTALKTKLDADTTDADAKADAQSIINDYRVYALIVPKINLVKTADDQLVAEAKLSDLATKLQTRISAAQTAGKNVTALQSGLTTMNSQISAAQAISTKIESDVIGLLPSDYNGNPSVLKGDRDQLKTAQSDIKDAVTSASTIVSSLKTL
ncbi:MAG TPA: hypothetical protein VFC50_00035 [Candidatus Dormibacteraeota bacterium]|nr:hypothetical protein [Candidatus Dormibacteraeota bacterium]